MTDLLLTAAEVLLAAAAGLCVVAIPVLLFSHTDAGTDIAATLLRSATALTIAAIAAIAAIVIAFTAVLP